MAKKPTTDMTKLTQRQRRRARDEEEVLQNKGVPKKQAEREAWGKAGEYPGSGKRRKNADPTDKPKVNSSQRGLNRKTRKTTLNSEKKA